MLLSSQEVVSERQEEEPRRRIGTRICYVLTLKLPPMLYLFLMLVPYFPETRGGALSFFLSFWIAVPRTEGRAILYINTTCIKRVK